MIIRSCVNQEAAVISGDRYDDRIRRFDIFRYDKINRSPALFIGIPDHSSEGIISDLRNQRDLCSQHMESQARFMAKSDALSMLILSISNGHTQPVPQETAFRMIMS